MAKKKDKDFKEIVELFIKDIKTQRKYTDKTLENYRSWLKAVHNWSNEKSIDWIKDTLISAESDPIEKIGGKYDANKGKIKVGKNHKYIYMMFAKWLAGQYHANVWLSIDKSSDLEFCKLIAKNALFCTCEVAEAVKSGQKGGDKNEKYKGNDYFSWYRNRQRRKNEDPPPKISLMERQKKTNICGVMMMIILFMQILMYMPTQPLRVQ